MLVGKITGVTGPLGITQILSRGYRNRDQRITIYESYRPTLAVQLTPIPALDGSRLIFAGIEAVTGKPIDPDKESLIHFVGFFLLMVLFVVITYKDILRLIR